MESNKPEIGFGDYMVEKTFLKRILSEKESIKISILALAGVIAVAASVFFFSRPIPTKIQNQNGSIEDVKKLGNTVQSLFSEVSSCSQNLVATGFGTTFNQMRSKLSYNGNIQLFYPKNSSDQGIFIEPKKTFQKVKIQSIGFTKIKQVTAFAGTYLADLRIQATDFSGHKLQPITVPFFVSTNAAGAITSCFATSYPYAEDPKFKLPKVSLEDVLCNQTSDGISNDLSSDPACVSKLSVAGSI